MAINQLAMIGLYVIEIIPSNTGWLYGCCGQLGGKFFGPFVVVVGRNN
jgi:hypothetical protein